jgi:hypothetical protein
MRLFKTVSEVDILGLGYIRKYNRIISKQSQLRSECRVAAINVNNLNPKRSV